MDGKVALVTGAGRGIGLGMAEGLAELGCAIAIQDIDAAAARDAAEKLHQASGVRTLALDGDIGDVSLPAQLISRTREALGGIHVLINNAAIQSQLAWEQLTVDHMEREMRADLIAPILLCQLSVPVFQAQRWGRIINVGSVQQRGGNAGMLAYSLSKAALEKFTTALARSLAKDQITVNNVAPGWFNTLRNRHDLRTPEIVAEKGKHIPVGRLGEPQDCAGIAMLLCSDAGSYITGQTIYVAGGW